MTREEFIDIIQYHESWFTSGFLPEEFIANQMKEWLASEDRNIEHYKWGAYKYILSKEDFSNDERLLAFVTLMESDSNAHLYKGAISLLVEIYDVSPRLLAELGGKRISNNPFILDRL